MGIYIPKMEMPKNCLKCPMANTYGGYGNLQGCFAVQGKEYAAIDERYDEESRPSWCPLVEVPKHGRLIDADAYEQLLYSLGNRDYRREKGSIKDAIKFLHSNYAPTIIEAEGEDGSI